MSIAYQDVALNAPQREEPSSLPIRTNRVLDPLCYRNDPVRYIKSMRREMGNDLARFIAEKCNIFSEPRMIDGELILSMDLTINDANAFADWVPRARREGVEAGRKSVMERIPYGLEPGQFYE